jgi:hypothetical protein
MPDASGDKAAREVLQALSRFPDGYIRGTFEGSVWGVTVRRSDDGRRIWLFAEDLAGTDIVSFNIYRLSSGASVLKPCEMSSEKIVAFMLGFVAD